MPASLLIDAAMGDVAAEFLCDFHSIGFIGDEKDAAPGPLGHAEYTRLPRAGGIGQR
jgi:hypothetical protein